MIFIETLNLKLLLNLLIIILIKKKKNKLNLKSTELYILNKKYNFSYYVLKLFTKKIIFFDFKFNDLTSHYQPKIGYMLQYRELNNIVNKVDLNELRSKADDLTTLYIKKNIAAVNNGPIFRKLYILEIIKWYFNKNTNKKYFISENNLFANQLKEHFGKYNVIYIPANKYKLNITKLFYKFISYIFLHYKISENYKFENSILTKHLSNLNLKKPDLFTDIVFYHTSLIKNSRINVYSSEKKHKFKKNDKQILNNTNINYYELSIKRKVSFANLNKWIKSFRNNFKLKLSSNNQESLYFQSHYNDYYFKKKLYKNLIYKSKSKISFTHFKFNSDHIALNAAIKETGGISTMWQLSYEELSTYDLSIYTDIYFSQSKYNTEAELNNRSIIHNKVIVGYPGDYRFKLLKKNLDKDKKIISFFDETSSIDEKWSSGDEQYISDYSYLFEKILKDDDLIIYLKPKKSNNLFNSLNPIKKLLQRALETKRLILFESQKKSFPPAYASLKSNLAIHNSLYAATAGVESVLSGTPTLYLDHDNWHTTKINYFGKNKFIFNNWNDLWNSVEDFFKSKKNFNNYHTSEYLNYLDPYRDGLASYRIGEYLNDLLNGFDRDIKAIDIIELANNKFKKKWGKDKIVY